MSQIMNKIAVELEDGSIKLFDTKAEAVDFLRRPAQTAALNKLVPEQPELVQWIIDVQDDLASAFESTKVRRVTKQEKKALEKALEAAKNIGDKNLAFLVENAQAVITSFKWPKVARGSEEEQAAALLKNVAVVTGGDEELAKWLIETREQILEAFEAGKPKREVNPGLAKYLAEQAAKKAAAAEAAEAADTE